jgi:hypothetical protein
MIIIQGQGMRTLSTVFVFVLALGLAVAGEPDGLILPPGFTTFSGKALVPANNPRSS